MPTHVIFDLDNTLYPPHRGVVERVDVLITRFVRERLGLDDDTAGALRRRYYTEYGTTLAGLMRHHDVLPDEYLAAVHAIDVDALLEPDPALRAMLLALPYTRVVFTNGSALHATRVLGRLGVTDCFAGIWGHSTAQRDILEAGDAEDALNAAAAIGDDRIQRRMGGGVQPESFTHGSSEQRVQWFRRGFDGGSIEACDTFGGR